MPNIVRILCALLLLVSGIPGYATPSKLLTIPPLGVVEPEATGIYYEKLLQLALAKGAATDDPLAEKTEYQLIHHPQITGRERYRLMVRQGTMDVIWSSSNKVREQELLPVKFNLLRGINEYRLLLIRPADQTKFDKVKSLADLQQFKIGSGVHWSDTLVYKQNNMPTVTSYAFDTMFRMLVAKRFDYMARSMQEIEEEEGRYRIMGLTLENNLLIHYSQPIYFFVNNDNAELAQHIERGLLIAQTDGSLDELFMSIPHFSAALEKIRHLNRRVIKLQSDD